MDLASHYLKKRKTLVSQIEKLSYTYTDTRNHLPHKYLKKIMYFGFLQLKTSFDHVFNKV